MSSLLDDIEASAGTSSSIRFLPSGLVITVADLWRRSDLAMSGLATHLGTAESLALVMDSTPSALAVFLAGLRGGRRVVSLPPPPRAKVALPGYGGLIGEALRLSGAAGVFCDPGRIDGLSSVGITAHDFEGCSGIGRAIERRGSGELVQFTSGSTSDPKGVRLSVDRLSANIEAILTRLGTRRGDHACSWLPLSHDMGLIGMTLSTLVAGAPRWANGSNLTLIKPETFVVRPESWLRACGDAKATVTASPSFGLLQAARRAGSAGGDWSLSDLRVCIVGGELVRASTLRTFTDTFHSRGFSELAFCPAYGLAEAGLAVTMTAPDEMWRSEPLSTDRSSDEHGSPDVLSANHEVVSCGRPLGGYSVEIESAGSASGPIAIAGPSISPGYLTHGRPDEEPGGRLLTSDYGYLSGGELVVLGRMDDVVPIAGRNIHLADIEHGVAVNTSIRAGRIRAVKDGEGYAVLVEAAPTQGGTALAEQINRVATGVCGVSPLAVIFVAKGALPTTTSGKPRRSESARLLRAGALPIWQRWTRGLQ
jgi:acyl-CoA synthetase (AMP-forming)/AMP-acid ligase II